MTAPDFLDSNVLIYAYDVSNSEKQRTARNFLKSRFTARVVISTQVLVEFAAVMLHKVSPPASAEAVMDALDALAPLRLIVPDGELVRRAIEAHVSYGLHFYDGMIIAAAERGGCGRIWSEDLNAGQKYFGITVTNPFN